MRSWLVKLTRVPAATTRKDGELLPLPWLITEADRPVAVLLHGARTKTTSGLWVFSGWPVARERTVPMTRPYGAAAACSLRTRTSAAGAGGGGSGVQPASAALRRRRPWERVFPPFRRVLG